MDTTQATADTTDHAPPVPSGPRTGQEAGAADSTNAPPKQAANPRRKGSTVGTRARSTREVEGEICGGAGRSRRTEPMTVEDVEVAAVPTASLGAKVPPAASPTPADAITDAP